MCKLGKRVHFFNVDIPALADLVAYLKRRDDQQGKIDALAAQVETLTTRLAQSQTGLQGAVNSQDQTKEK